jgi:hypothetical protein
VSPDSLDDLVYMVARSKAADWTHLEVKVAALQGDRNGVGAITGFELR